MNLKLLTKVCVQQDFVDLARDVPLLPLAAWVSKKDAKPVDVESPVAILIMDPTDLHSSFIRNGSPLPPGS